MVIAGNLTARSILRRRSGSRLRLHKRRGAKLVELAERAVLSRRHSAMERQASEAEVQAPAAVPPRGCAGCLPCWR
jgi:hypothetical protein